jgi:hypothetical protein
MMLIASVLIYGICERNARQFYPERIPNVVFFHLDLVCLGTNQSL